MVLILGVGLHLSVRNAQAQSWNFSPYRSIVRWSFGQGASNGRPGEAGLMTAFAFERWMTDRVRLRLQGDVMRWFYDVETTKFGVTSASRATVGVGFVRVLSGDRPGGHMGPSTLMNPYVGAGVALFHTHYRGAQTFLLTSGGVFLVAGLEFHRPAGRWGAFAEFQMTARKSLPGFETDSILTGEAAGTAGVKIRFN